MFGPHPAPQGQVWQWLFTGGQDQGRQRQHGNRERNGHTRESPENSLPADDVSREVRGARAVQSTQG